MARTFHAGIVVVTLIALLTGGAFAGQTCGLKAKSAGKPTAQEASAKADFCTATAAKHCAEKLGITYEECVKLCESGHLTLVNLSIDGMTCSGCEGRITGWLKESPGVIRVNSVSHKDGSGSVYFDTRKGKVADMVKAVVDHGYMAEVIPAVATVTETTGTKTAKAGCDPAKCAMKCLKDMAKTKATEEKKGSSQ
ncbi:MAG: heavy-metal-associated domain-containing protein [Candidatus Zixiibacteriota bacterium]|nr:MAG: heavy-metal-associated domain-containing protein [candidate division Zixibacteria bacterium]